MRVDDVENGDCVMLFLICLNQVFVFMRSFMERGERKVTMQYLMVKWYTDTF